MFFFLSFLVFKKFYGPVTIPEVIRTQSNLVS